MGLPKKAEKENVKEVTEKEEKRTKNKKSIPKVSEKRKILNKEYEKINRRKRKKKNRRCKIRIPGVCIGRPVHNHHKKGRIGDLLIDTKFMVDACDPCNEWCVSHPKEAMALGHIISRLKKEEAV